MEKRHVDFIIVGQGIAGTGLVWALHQQGASYIVINQSSDTSSSMVAAGLYNPITGRNMVKTWNADQLFPHIRPFYQNLEQELDASFLHEIGIYRPFFSKEEQNDWQGRISDRQYEPYLQEVLMNSLLESTVLDAQGGLMLKNAGYVNVSGLIQRFKKWLVDKGCYYEDLFNSRELSIAHEEVRYRNIVAKQIIFCTGLSGNLDEFNWLPFNPVKGELMDVKASANFNFILNRGVFMVPLGKSIYRVGSTYRQNTELQFEGKTEDELKSKLSVIYNGELEVLTRRVGIRPATRDRKPFIGQHPTKSNLYIFSGFGSKGVSFVPYYAQQFVNYLSKSLTLDMEVDVQRYYGYYPEVQG